MDVTTITTEGGNSLLAGVRSTLEDADNALLAVAFVNSGGVHLLEPQLRRLGSAARLLLTTTFGEKGLISSALDTLSRHRVDVGILNPGKGTFHPKVYLARRGSESIAIIGSPNLTRGLATNVEAAVMLRGKPSDEPIRSAWEFAERLWADSRRIPWQQGSMPTTEEVFDPELLRLLEEVVAANNGWFETIAHSKPNRVTQVTPMGLYVETDASKAKGRSELIPAWMFELAYEYLRKHGSLSNQYLLADDGLNVKRSSGVIAILAKLPGVEATLDKRNRVTLTWRSSQPGTTFWSRFHAGPDRARLEPVEAEVIELAGRRKVVAYPDLRAAAGHAQAATEPPDDELVSLPLEKVSSDMFAVRVSGTSMDGGKDPLRDGDWAVMRVAHSMSPSDLENRAVLVETRGDSFGAQYQIKRRKRRDSGWLLASDNPDGPKFEETEEMVPIARLERAIRPESLAPAVGTMTEDHELATRFGLDSMAARSDRYGGHLFIFVDREGMLEASDRLRFAGITPRAAETAFVLIAREGSWIYAGVARQTGERGLWSLPDAGVVLG